MFSDITKSNSCCPQTNFAYPQNGVDERPGVSGIIMRKIANCLPDITSWDSWNRLKARVGYGRLCYPFQRHIPRCRTTSTSLQENPYTGKPLLAIHHLSSLWTFAGHTKLKTLKFSLPNLWLFITAKVFEF